MVKILVLDACALIAYFSEEEGKDVVKDIIKQTVCDSETRIYMHRLNLLEVYNRMIKKYNMQDADEMMDDVRRMPISVVDGLRKEIFKKAGYLKSKYKMSLADSVAVAESIARGGTLVTSDHHELEAVERGEGVKILWFR